VKIDIVSRHKEIPSSVEAYARDKVEKLGRYLRRISKVEVVLDRSAERFVAEMRLHADLKGVRVVAHVMNEDARAAVDLLMDKMERQLVRLKERRRTRHSRGIRQRGAAHPEGRRRMDEPVPVGEMNERGGDQDSAGDEDDEDLTYEDIINEEREG
jgi:putative sigma-54 modulation protein